MMQPVIKWTGSKRSQANTIVSYFPKTYNTYYEPFVGGGSILYAAQPKTSMCGDICKPLIDLWNEIKNNPKNLIDSYYENWNRLYHDGQDVYYEIRKRFNEHKNPCDFLFLTRTCVNGLIRFNSHNEFNNSFHLSRHGIKPDKLEKIIYDWSQHIQNTIFISGGYDVTTSNVKQGDLIYLDPPYFHTKGQYYGTIDYDKFISYLEQLNIKGVNYILSFDGIQGDSNLTVTIPKELYKRHIFLSSGNSTFSKVMTKKDIKVLESLYLNW